jgi:hypothetical protein
MIVSWRGSAEAAECGWLAFGRMMCALAVAGRVAAAIIYLDVCLAVTDVECVRSPHLYILPAKRRGDKLAIALRLRGLWGLWVLFG